MVNFVSKISFLSYFSFLVLLSWGKLVLRNLKSYKNSSYTTYEPWNLQGELNFVFKTSQATVFLAYQDNGEHDFIEIFLYNGDIRLRSTMGDCNMEEVYVKGDFSDLHWHRVRVIIEQNNFSISVDDSTTRLQCKPQQAHRQNRRAGGAYLYVANFSPMSKGNLNKMVFPGTLYETNSGFNGCLGDLWITDNKGRPKLAKIISTKSTEIGCNNSCSTPRLNKCQNQGKCIDEIGRVECDCLGSGYEGLFCSKPSASMWFNASGYILYDVGTYQPGRSTLGNDIAFRFATTQLKGVVMFTDVADDHVMVELLDGFLRVSWDLGQGGLVLMSHKGCLHDGAWHMVTIKRAKRRIRITVDDQRPIFAAIPGKFSFLDFKGGKEMLYFGGGPLNKAFNRSLSRTNYTGFLQHLYFDEFNVINETIHGSMFELVGEAVLNASSLFHLITTNPTPVGECSRKTSHNSEYLCEEIDDEDLCEIATSGTGPDGVDCDSTDGDCSKINPDIQEITGGPSVVLIPPVNESSSESMTSRIHPSPTPTTLPGMTKFINKSADNQTQESIATFKSPNVSNKFNTSGKNSFIVKPSSTVYRSAKQSVIQEWPRNISGILTSLTSYAVPKDSGLKSGLTTSVLSSVHIINNNNKSSSKPASTKAFTVNGSPIRALKYSASLTTPYDSINISAVKSAAGKVAVNQAWVYGTLLVSLPLWM